jgi:NADH-quinone oxidoreductase subunit F
LDLHLTNAHASEKERAAVDAELGVPATSWQGGPRQLSDTRAVYNGDNHGRRHRLLPVLHAVQKRVGWISPGALNYVALRLDIAPAEVYGVASFYGMFAMEERAPVVAHVCDDIACFAHGSETLCAELEREIGPAGSRVSGGGGTWLRSQCLGLCERAPAALISAAGETPRERVLAPATARGVRVLMEDGVHGRLPSEPDELNISASVPQVAHNGVSVQHSAHLRLLGRVGQNARSVEVYEGLGGYAGLRKAMELGPEGTLRELAASKLLGRGISHCQEMGSAFSAT